MTTPPVLGERYEIGGVLGRGGMAEVHRGRDLRLGREVAVKVLRQDLARDPSFQVRFRREAQAAASLNHPAIVAVYDTGEDRSSSGATPYIVMEYVEGETLRDVLRREGVLAPQRAMTLAADICNALDFSHRNGIVHRDVKPGNVMITPEGTVKVMDFGIARAVSDSAATMTSTAAVIGTAQYLSPEQARGESVDARSDVYSTGCLLYELVTGAPPFTGDSPVSVAYQHVREDPRLPSSVNPAIPPDLDAILLKALSKNPANRYQSAADMRTDLLRALAGQRVEATPVMGDAERTAIIGAPPGGYGGDWDDEDGEDRTRRRNRVIAAVVAGLLLIGGVVAVALLLGDGTEPPAATPPVATQVSVPNVVGQDEATATATLQGAGLTVGQATTQVTRDEAQIGTVLGTTPPSGTQVDQGSTVALVLGVGPDTVEVPAVIGLDADRAEATLENAGFETVTTEEIDSVAPEGQVTGVEPGEGQAVDPGTTVTLQVSDGDAQVPDVTGQQQAAATQALRAAGFTNVVPEEVEAEQAAGTVVATDPAAGDQASADDEITLQVSSGPAEEETVAVPDVAGQTGTAALDALEGAGFTDVTVVDATGEEAEPAGATAVRTNPPAGSEVTVDTPIVLTVQGPAPTATPSPTG
ncbi:serine/threonine protein kinase [Geodermatophilus pulveris]|uniref:non-specific serine/threonine protein kinase n=1 Tax=Geodermatophilus pulveris TaxID=1564159 RepID=A0A239FMK8_9ACTN|nr:Stk1 family PASTA domain-containing Ser/Thr kinase [Geodermatophilus pulveris]SNS57482.1 serine/threonine protein kinase [Geodermatophilus pulveris]